MPKQPKLRPNYLSDARYLFRLSHAVEADSDRSLVWRKLAIVKIQELAHILLGIPDGEIQKEKILTQGEVEAQEAGEAQANTEARKARQKARQKARSKTGQAR